MLGPFSEVPFPRAPFLYSTFIVRNPRSATRPLPYGNRFFIDGNLFFQRFAKNRPADSGTWPPQFGSGHVRTGTPQENLTIVRFKRGNSTSPRPSKNADKSDSDHDGRLSTTVGFFSDPSFSVRGGIVLRFARPVKTVRTFARVSFRRNVIGKLHNYVFDRGRANNHPENFETRRRARRFRMKFTLFYHNNKTNIRFNVLHARKHERRFFRAAKM